MSEKFSLKWNDFQSNVSRTFSLLRSEQEFFDVSLVSDDQKTMSAHKLVLSASSPYFRQILTHNKHSHPLLCLDGVSSGELQCVLDYIYQGEVLIYQEQLDRFLQVAQRLKLEGLTGNANDDPETKLHDLVEETVINVENEYLVSSGPMKTENVIRKPRKLSNSPIIVHNSSITNTDEIDQKIGEYVIRGEDGNYSCGYCGKASRNKADMKKHVETHLEGLSFPCQNCDKTFRSRNSLSKHNSVYHRTSFKVFPLTS